MVLLVATKEIFCFIKNLFNSRTKKLEKSYFNGYILRLLSVCGI